MSKLVFRAAALPAVLFAALSTSGANAQGYDQSEPYYADPDATSWVVFSGGDFVEDSYFIYSGAIVALNGDIGRPGFLLRGFAGHGDYGYESSSVPGGNVDADVWIGDLMLGYQTYTPGLRAAGYVGVEYQDHDLNPNDPSNPVRGGEAGFKVVGEIETLEDSRLYAGVMGSYSTAFDSYWVRGRVGYNFGRFIIGPEGTLLGSETFESQRLGAFVKFPVRLARDMTVALELTGGYAWVDDEEDNGDFGGLGGSDDSAYFGVGLSTAF